jgi:hypothetical protein
MFRTSLQLITRALERIQRVGAGQDPSAEDAQLVREHINPLLEELAQQEVIFVADTEAIPDIVFLPLANRLAAEVSADFGLGAVEPAVINSLNNRLRLTWVAKPLYGPQRAVYY